MQYFTPEVPDDLYSNEDFSKKAGRRGASCQTTIATVLYLPEK
jgi:hypothetical protein